VLRRAPTAARPLGRARHAREQARPSAAGWTGMLALAVAAVAADQLTKATVVHRLRVGEAVDVLPGLQFWHVRNIGLLLGGSVSNLWDRAYNNFVTDFIYLHVLPNFNLADSFIVTGVGLLIFALVRGDPGERVEGFP
jgi:lipoprotein signal peptidase